MNERSVMKAICSIEQKLLFEDSSPSIHNPFNPKESSKREVGPFGGGSSVER